MINSGINLSLRESMPEIGLEYGDICLCGKHLLVRSAHRLFDGRKLSHGVGINDLPIAVKVDRIGCAFYAAWQSMMSRCYGKKLLERRPAYIGCSVDKRWHSAREFFNWASKNGWRDGWHLDKDIIQAGNKVYSPESCVFVPPAINALITTRGAGRGDYPLGVSRHTQAKTYMACISINGKKRHLGCFDSELIAHAAWQESKAEEIRRVIGLYNDLDFRVNGALMFAAENLLRHKAEGLITMGFHSGKGVSLEEFYKKI